MSLLQTSARFILFGPQRAKEITLRSIIGRGVYNTGRRTFGMPPVDNDSLWAWLKQKVAAFWAQLVGVDPNRLPIPADLPPRLYRTIDHILRSRGGLDKAGYPYYWANARATISSPFFWAIPVDYQPSTDPGTLRKMEESLEDAITRAGYDYNIRIMSRPLRIEIDKPQPPLVRLADHWSSVANYATNQRLALCGLAWRGGRSVTLTMCLDGEDFSSFIAGAPGSGKTQLSMTLILSLALSNSPASLAMLIVDPKAIDWRPFNRLPHLLAPVITEPARAAIQIQALVAEMDDRTQRAAAGDTTFLQQSILLYVDELSDLLNSLPAQQSEQTAIALQRLAQKGRGVGFIIVGATQRVYDVPAAAYTKLNARFVGKMRNANDSVAASGVPGTQTNRLPGKGSFELYCSDQTGLRLQSPFVADSRQPDYEQQLAPFLNDIANRWTDQPPGWTMAQPSAEPATTDPLPDRIDIPIELYEWLRTAHDNGQRIGNRALRNQYQAFYGKSLDGTRAALMLEAFLALFDGDQPLESAAD